MRALLLPLLLLTASCSGEAEKAQPSEAAENGASVLGSELQTFAGAGKDRLCIGGAAAPAAFITYAPDGINNCSARGRIEDQSGKLSFVAQEDASCRIDLQRDGDTRLTLGRPSPGCAYYCGPDASIESKTFARMDKPEPVSDLAGDPLC